MNIYHSDADIAMNIDTYIGNANIFSGSTCKLLGGEKKMHNALKKWVTGKDQQRNKLPTKTSPRPKPKTNLSSLVRLMRKRKAVRAKESKQSSKMQRKLKTQQNRGKWN